MAIDVIGNTRIDIKDVEEDSIHVKQAVAKDRFRDEYTAFDNSIGVDLSVDLGPRREYATVRYLADFDVDVPDDADYPDGIINALTSQVDGEFPDGLEIA